MSGTSRAQLCFLLLSVTALRGHARFLDIQDNEISPEGLLSLLSNELKRELPEEFVYRRALRCLDMVAIEGQFTFTAERPQLNCAVFFIGEPSDIISIEYDSVNIDCRGGDFIKVFDGWVMKGEKFPSTQDHLLPLYERYSDYCENGVSRPITRSSQNVAMLFFRLHQSGSSFTVTFRKLINPFPCNVVSQTPEGSFTMVIPQQHRNCSFSIIYPVEIQIGELSLGQHNDLKVSIQRSILGCAGSGDFVELLGGNGMDTSKMFPMADLCYSFNGPAQMKVGCDNTVVRMVSSGKFVNRVSFRYRLLGHQELQQMKGNSVEDVCLRA
ncbi:corticotropin-releasing factor-binding protein isoform X1 [Ctenopharyngodon idella]|uniref:corticotropin-releasing factor-binding protein isoform X1 n=1 Tax=Ctenopharyngodon idella TaxID=7959 RepID=UPI002232B147|nr:corticotropin-releasing factor-binding protein isoform X1 [Ctenopharyngodon idella]